MSGAKFQIGDTVRYTEGYGEPIGVIQARTFDPELMWWTIGFLSIKTITPTS